jgi:hypothetical protein
VSVGAFGDRLNLLPVTKRLGAFAAFHKPFYLKDAVAAVEQALRTDQSRRDG